MSRQDRREYIAVQAMCAMIQNDTQSVDRLALMHTNEMDEHDAMQCMELVNASFNVADLMMQESDKREKEAVA